MVRLPPGIPLSGGRAARICLQCGRAGSDQDQTNASQKPSAEGSLTVAEHREQTIIRRDEGKGAGTSPVKTVAGGTEGGPRQDAYQDGRGSMGSRKILVPEELRATVFHYRLVHRRAGLYGTISTVARMRKSFLYPGMMVDVAALVRDCSN